MFLYLTRLIDHMLTSDEYLDQMRREDQIAKEAKERQRTLDGLATLDSD